MSRVRRAERTAQASTEASIPINRADRMSVIGALTCRQ
jgi:hypothetical protein